MEKGTINSCRAHNATSFVPVVLVSGREVSEDIWRFQENEAVDSGPTRFRLVVLSSYIELGFLFVGRAYTEGLTEGFVVVGPPVHERSRNLHARVRTCKSDIHT